MRRRGRGRRPRSFSLWRRRAYARVRACVYRSPKRIALTSAALESLALFALQHAGAPHEKGRPVVCFTCFSVSRPPHLPRVPAQSTRTLPISRHPRELALVPYTLAGRKPRGRRTTASSRAALRRARARAGCTSARVDSARHTAAAARGAARGCQGRDLATRRALLRGGEAARGAAGGQRRAQREGGGAAGASRRGCCAVPRTRGGCGSGARADGGGAGGEAADEREARGRAGGAPDRARVRREEGAGVATGSGGAVGARGGVAGEGGRAAAAASGDARGAKALGGPAREHADVSGQPCVRPSSTSCTLSV
mmetsp:Transcript_82385/g.247057  ORF Transcript_82385/g.247057 Transcript_82385/m.247057 type:complete len:311 (-) Transcript_82385:185-1117(-)